MIDKEHKVIWRDDNNKEWINYNKVQYSTSHVHMMLNTALMQVIDTCECVIFVNTPNSVKPGEVVDKVVSPWIYFELAMTNLIRKKELKEYRLQLLLESEKRYSDLKVEYNLDTKHLIDLSIDDLHNWRDNFTKIKSLTTFINNALTEKRALDYLYELK